MVTGCQIFEVPIELEAAGNENAVGLSVRFDPGVVRLVEILPGAASQDAIFQVNDRRMAEGRLGLAVAKSVGIAFTAGKIELARLRMVSTGLRDYAALEIEDKPIAREVADISAESQPTTFLPGAIQIKVGPRLAQVRRLADGGYSISFSADLGTNWVLEASPDLVNWEKLGTQIASEGQVSFADTATKSVAQRFYRLREAK